jgi:hypothetical protein
MRGVGAVQVEVMRPAPAPRPSVHPAGSGAGAAMLSLVGHHVLEQQAAVRADAMERDMPDQMARPARAFRERTNYRGPPLSLAPGRLGDERQLGYIRPPIRDDLQSALTKCRLLQPTLIRIADDCDRVSRYVSRVVAEADLEK